MGINHTLEQRADGQFLSLKQRDFYERTYGILRGRGLVKALEESRRREKKHEDLKFAKD